MWHLSVAMHELTAYKLRTPRAGLLSHHVLEAFDQSASLASQMNRHRGRTGPLKISIICYWYGYYVVALCLQGHNQMWQRLPWCCSHREAMRCTAAGFWQGRMRVGTPTELLDVFILAAKMWQPAAALPIKLCWCLQAKASSGAGQI